MSINRINNLFANLIVNSKQDTSPCFLHEILYRLNLVERHKNFLDNDYFETLAIDKQGNLFFNPEYIETLSTAELYGCLLHEAMHLSFFHFERLHRKDIDKWNYVTDLIINNILIKNGFSLPKNCLYKKLPNNISEEELYTKIQDQYIIKIKNHATWINSPINNSYSSSELIVKEACEKIKSNKTRSFFDEYLIEQSNNKKESSIDWIELMKDFLVPISQNYKYNHSKRSTISEMMYQQRPKESTFIPKLQATNSKDNNIIIVVDTSGSTNQILDIFYNEIIKIINQLDITTNIICCDDSVKSFFELSKNKISNSTTLAGGGFTNFSPPFYYIQENKINVSGLIYITDGYGSCQAPEPNFPVLWLSTGQLNFCNFGKFVKFNII